MSKTTAERLQTLVNNKAAIKAAIIAKGQDVADNMSTYATAIGNIQTGGDTEAYYAGPLTATAKSFGGVSVSTNDHIKIRGNNGVSYTVEQWDALSGKGTTIKPIGFDMQCWGEHFIWHFKTKYRDTTNKTYYDVSGTTAQTDGKLRHSQYQHPLITGEMSKTDGNGTTAKAVVSNGIITLSTTNSPKTWQIKTNCGGVYAFLSNNVKDRFDALVAQTEWFRHRAAIDSGLETDAADGTAGTVTIVTDGGEMYFAVNGTQTTKLAKYNVHTTILNGDHATQAVVDAVYAKQKANGVNMNMAIGDGSAKPVITEGCEGATAYAFNRKWMIATPVLSRCNAASFTLDYNIPDAPAVSYALWLRAFYGNQNIILPNKRMLQAYWTNKNTILNSMVTYLNNARGGSCGVPSNIDTDTWSSLRINANYAWVVNVVNGYMYGNNTSYRFVTAGVSAL